MAPQAVEHVTCADKRLVARAPQVLEKSSGQPKALYRRAQAHMGAGDYVEAEVDIKAALQVRAWWLRLARQVKALLWVVGVCGATG